MKRTEPKRKRPMWQGKDGKPKKRKRMKQRSAKRQREQEVRVDVLMSLLLERGNACEARVPAETDRNGVETHRCKGVATDGHELLPRSGGGDPTDPENIKLVCRPCHSYIHEHPIWSLENGLLRSRYG